MSQKYKPEVFDRESLESAKNIIMTDEAGVTRDERWSQEAQWLVNILEKHIHIKDKVVLDFGCGIGRISKTLVDKGAFVVGVDISKQMREHANTQGIGEKFTAISPKMLDVLTANNLRFDLGISIWVLQHCPELEEDAGRIIKAIRPGGGVFVVDMIHRAIPVDGGWHEDHKSVFGFLSAHLTLIHRWSYDLPNGPENLRRNAWVAYFKKC